MAGHCAINAEADLDRIQFRLMFGRILKPERNTIPDFNIDFACGVTRVCNALLGALVSQMLCSLADVRSATLP